MGKRGKSGNFMRGKRKMSTGGSGEVAGEGGVDGGVSGDCRQGGWWECE